MSDGSYSISDIQGYFEFVIKKHETLAENPPIKIYPNKIKNRINFKIKTGYQLELLSPETMKLLGSTIKDVEKDKNGEDVPKLESVEVVLMHCNLVNTQQIFVGLPDVFKTSSRHVLKMSSTPLERNNFLSSNTSSRRLEDVLKMSCEEILKRS